LCGSSVLTSIVMSGVECWCAGFCSECKHVMAYDAPSGLLFPPLVRPARIPSAAQNSKESQNKKTDETNTDNEVLAYHLGCAPKDL
jgi:hypothetical protein